MAGATLKRKLIYTVTRPALHVPACCPHQQSISISLRRSQQAQKFTFGSDVDALIAPHLAKLSKRPKPRSRTKPSIPASLVPGSTLPPEREQALDEALTQISTRPRRRLKLSEIPDDHYASRAEPIPFEQTPAQTTSTLKSRPKTTSAREAWQVQKSALQNKFGDAGWSPRKKLSPDAMDGIRSLHEEDPDKYSTPVLAQQFKVSPEAIRRILKSRWMTEGKKEERRERWARRHDRLWDQKAALGLLPERERNKSVGGGDEWEQELARSQILEEARAAG